MFRWSIGLAGAFALAGPMSVIAKPIAFADGYTVMAEYGAGPMKEAQLFYAPRYDFSVGGGLGFHAGRKELFVEMRGVRFNHGDAFDSSWHVPLVFGINVF